MVLVCYTLLTTKSCPDEMQSNSEGPASEVTQPWSAAMATTLLRVAAAVPGAGGHPQSEGSGGAPAAATRPGGVASSPGGTGGQGFSRQQLRRWRLWIAALPPKVPLAWAHCRDAGEALMPLGDEGIALEAAAVQQLMLESWPQVVLPPCPWSPLQHQLAMVPARCAVPFGPHALGLIGICVGRD